MVSTSPSVLTDSTGGTVIHIPSAGVDVRGDDVVVSGPEGEGGGRRVGELWEFTGDPYKCVNL